MTTFDVRPRRGRRFTIGAFGAVAALGLSGCGMFSSAATHDSRSFEAPPEGLTIESDYDLEVSPHSGDTLEVDRWISEDREPSWKLTGDTLELGIGRRPALDNGPSRAEVRVPEGTVVDISVSEGDATVTDLSDPRVKVTNGDITATDVAGQVRARGTNGDIEVETSTTLEAVSLRTTNGDVTLDAAEPPNEVRMRTESGNLTARLPGATEYDVRADAETGDVHVDVPQRSGGHPLHLTSATGDINVESR